MPHWNHDELPLIAVSDKNEVYEAHKLYQLKQQPLLPGSSNCCTLSTGYVGVALETPSINNECSLAKHDD